MKAATSSTSKGDTSFPSTDGIKSTLKPVSNDGIGCGIDVPDSAWKEEIVNHTRIQNFQKSRRPPKNAVIRIKVIFNKGWVNSAGEGRRRTRVRIARQKAVAVLIQAEYIFNNKYSKRNRLKTAFKFEMEKGTY